MKKRKAKSVAQWQLIALALIVLAFIAFFALPHGKSEGTITAFGIKLKVSGNNQAEVAPGIKMKDAEAGENIRLNDTTGKGVDGQKLKAGGDIEATSSVSNAPPKP